MKLQATIVKAFKCPMDGTEFKEGEVYPVTGLLAGAHENFTIFVGVNASEYTANLQNIVIHDKDACWRTITPILLKNSIMTIDDAGTLFETLLENYGETCSNLFTEKIAEYHRKADIKDFEASVEQAIKLLHEKAAGLGVTLQFSCVLTSGKKGVK